MSGGAPRGNRNSAKGRAWSDELRKELMMTKSLNVVAVKLIEMAKDGDLGAIKEIGDRLDGKSVQSLEVTTNPLHEMTEIELELRARQLSDRLGIYGDAGSPGIREESDTTH